MGREIPTRSEDDDEALPDELRDQAGAADRRVLSRPCEPSAGQQ